MSETVETVSTSSLKLDEHNVRDELGDLSELIASIKSAGILEPLLVDENGVVVCGARRLEAAKQLARKVPIIRRSFTDEERLVAQTVENLQRQSLTPLEEARAFDRFRQLNLTTRQIASRVGVSQSWVVKRLALLKLPEETQKQVSVGKLEVGVATELTRIADDPKLVAKLAQKSVGGSTWVPQDVHRELERRDNAKKKKQFEKELAAKKVKVLVLEEDGYYAVPPEGTALVATQRFYAGMHPTVYVDAEKHAKLKCSAKGVHPRTLEIVECCTDPKSHPDPEEQRQKEREKQAAAAAAQQELMRAQAEHRFAFLKAAVAKPTKELVLDVAYLALVDTDAGYSYAEGSYALALLELEPPEDVTNEQEWLEQKIDEISSTATGKLRLTIAYAIDMLEGQGELEPVLDLLGYEPPKAALKAVPDKKEVVAAAA